MNSEYVGRSGTRRRTSSGKQTELARRDRYFLKLAREILEKEDFAALTISRVAEESGFTRSTLYQRFLSREGVLLELWIECLGEIAEFMVKAASLEGNTRERATAAGEAFILYLRRHPHNLRLMGVIAAEDTQQALSDEQRARLGEADTVVSNIVLSLAQEATEVGELTLPQGADLETFSLVLWVMHYGVTEIMRGGLSLTQLGLTDPLESFQNGLQWILDGYGWRPFSSEYDYGATRRRIRALLDCGEHDV